MKATILYMTVIVVIVVLVVLKQQQQQQQQLFHFIPYTDTAWSQWGPCSAPCDGGTQERTLGCKTANNDYNSACMTTTATCNLKPCNGK